MYKKKLFRAQLCALFLAVLVPAFASAAAATTLSGLYQWTGVRIVDDADVLSSTDEQELDRLINDLDKETGAQLGIITMSTLADSFHSDLESFSRKQAEEWKLGQEGKDNGILILVVVDDHLARIEVGAGLEDKISLYQQKRIMDYKMTNNFRNGYYNTGLIEAVKSLTNVIKGLGLDDTSTRAAPAETEKKEGSTLGAIILMIVVGVLVIAIIIKAIINKKKGIKTDFQINKSPRLTTHKQGSGKFNGGGTSGSW